MSYPYRPELPSDPSVRKVPSGMHSVRSQCGLFLLVYRRLSCLLFRPPRMDFPSLAPEFFLHPAGLKIPPFHLHAESGIRPRLWRKVCLSAVPTPRLSSSRADIPDWKMASFHLCLSDRGRTRTTSPAPVPAHHRKTLLRFPVSLSGLRLPLQHFLPQSERFSTLRNRNNKKDYYRHMSLPGSDPVLSSGSGMSRIPSHLRQTQYHLSVWSDRPPQLSQRLGRLYNPLLAAIHSRLSELLQCSVRPVEQRRYVWYCTRSPG